MADKVITNTGALSTFIICYLNLTIFAHIQSFCDMTTHLRVSCPLLFSTVWLEKWKLPGVSGILSPLKNVKWNFWRFVELWKQTWPRCFVLICNSYPSKPITFSSWQVCLQKFWDNLVMISLTLDIMRLFFLQDQPVEMLVE